MSGKTPGRITLKQLLLVTSLAPLLTSTAAGLAQVSSDPQRQASSVEISDDALLNAVKRGDLQGSRYLLQQGANPNTATEDQRHRSLLIIATIRGNTEMIRLLLDSGASVDQYDGDGLTALNWAALRSQTDVARILLDNKASANLADEQQVTPLLYAIGTGNRELTTLLLERGANPNVESVANKMTPLLLAIENRNSSLVEALLDNAAAVNGTNSNGYSPLMAAAEAGDLQITQLLLSRGAHPGLMDNKGRTAVFFAQRGGHSELVDLLSQGSRQSPSS